MCFLILPVTFLIYMCIISPLCYILGGIKLMLGTNQEIVVKLLKIGWIGMMFSLIGDSILYYSSITGTKKIKRKQIFTVFAFVLCLVLSLVANLFLLNSPILSGICYILLSIYIIILESILTYKFIKDE